MSKSILQVLRAAEKGKDEKSLFRLLVPKYYARNVAQKTSRNHTKFLIQNNKSQLRAISELSDVSQWYFHTQFWFCIGNKVSVNLF
jgi:hypothetical protein